MTTDTTNETGCTCGYGNCSRTATNGKACPCMTSPTKETDREIAERVKAAFDARIVLPLGGRYTEHNRAQDFAMFSLGYRAADEANANLRLRIAELQDQWYSPEHMDKVEERTIEPLRKRIAELEAERFNLMRTQAMNETTIALRDREILDWKRASEAVVNGPVGEIARYKLNRVSDAPNDFSKAVEEDDEGSWVKYVDHLAAMRGRGASGARPVVERIERGWPAHFICAQRCLFRRNTLLTFSETRWIVSTVGLMKSDDNKYDTIGAFGRYYETMAFEAKKDGPYWDIDVSKQLSFESDWSICADSFETLPNDADNLANDMHETVVAELLNKIQAPTPGGTKDE